MFEFIYRLKYGFIMFIVAKILVLILELVF